MSNAHPEPVERFENELHALLDRWEEKPPDDRLSPVEIVGVLTNTATQVSLDAVGARVVQDEDDEDGEDH